MHSSQEISADIVLKICIHLVEGAGCLILIDYCCPVAVIVLCLFGFFLVCDYSIFWLYTLVFVDNDTIPHIK